MRHLPGKSGPPGARDAQEMETFAYSVAHDLKAPLRGIDGYSRLLLEDYGDHLDEEGNQFLQRIRSATQQMNQLIIDLLNYSRLERRSIENSVVNLHDVLRVILDEYAPKGDTPVAMETDPTWRDYTFTIVTTLVAGIASGLLPAWRASRVNLNETLKAAAGGRASGRRHWMRNVLVVGQVAFSLVVLVSAALFSLSHGANDAQKTMGIIALALIVTGHLNEDFTRPPTWVIVSSALAMSLGTYAGGWRIIKTMGTRIAKIDPPQGFAAQTSCAAILWTTAHYGFPVSTTQTITGSVMGAGASRRFSAVRWGIAGNIAVAWVFTLPAAGLVGALMESVTKLPAGNLIVFLLAGAIAAVAFIGRRYETRRLVPAPT